MTPIIEEIYKIINHKLNPNYTARYTYLFTYELKRREFIAQTSSTSWVLCNAILDRGVYDAN